MIIGKFDDLKRFIESIFSERNKNLIIKMIIKIKFYGKGRKNSFSLTTFFSD